jgi:hypothetical protein
MSQLALQTGLLAPFPISEMTGGMWPLLIQLAGKINRCKEDVVKTQTIEYMEMVHGDGGEFR